MQPAEGTELEGVQPPSEMNSATWAQALNVHSDAQLSLNAKSLADNARQEQAERLGRWRRKQALFPHYCQGLWQEIKANPGSICRHVVISLVCGLAGAFFTTAVSQGDLDIREAFASLAHEPRTWLLYWVALVLNPDHKERLGHAWEHLKN